MRGADAGTFICVCEGGQGKPRYSDKTMANFNPNEVVFTFLAHHRAHCTPKQREVADRLASYRRRHRPVSSSTRL